VVITAPKIETNTRVGSNERNIGTKKHFRNACKNSSIYGKRYIPYGDFYRYCRRNYKTRRARHAYLEIYVDDWRTFSLLACCSRIRRLRRSIEKKYAYGETKNSARPPFLIRFSFYNYTDRRNDSNNYRR